MAVVTGFYREACRAFVQFEEDWITDAVVATQIQGQTEVLIPPVTAGGSTALDNHNVTLRGNG